MRVASVLLGLVVLVAACGGQEPQDATASPLAVDPQLTAPLEALPPCDNIPQAVDHEPIPGLYLPEGVIIAQVTDSGPQVQVQGFVHLTPVQLRLDYVERHDLDVEVLLVEDELFEAEVLLTDGEHRSYVKAQAICNEGSAFVAIVAPESSAGAVPSPQGSPVAP